MHTLRKAKYLLPYDDSNDQEELASIHLLVHYFLLASWPAM